MKKLILAGLVALVAASAPAQVLRIQRPTSWGNPYAPFQVGRYYMNPYSQVIYIRQVQLQDGAPILLLENIRGRWCLAARACALEPTLRGLVGPWWPVEVRYDAR
jgi:hypothetical protein